MIPDDLEDRIDVVQKIYKLVRKNSSCPQDAIDLLISVVLYVYRTNSPQTEASDAALVADTSLYMSETLKNLRLKGKSR